MKSLDNFEDSNMISKLFSGLMVSVAVGLMIFAYSYSISRIIL